MESENKAGDSGFPCLVPSQDLITESPQKKENLVDCTLSMSTYKLQGVFHKFSLA